MKHTWAYRMGQIKLKFWSWEIPVSIPQNDIVNKLNELVKLNQIIELGMKYCKFSVTFSSRKDKIQNKTLFYS